MERAAPPIGKTRCANHKTAIFMACWDLQVGNIRETLTQHLPCQASVLGSLVLRRLEQV